MAGGLPDTEELVIDGWHRFNGRRSKPQQGEALMRRTEVFNHQVKWGISRDYFALRAEYQVRSPAQLKNSHIRPLVHGPHPDGVHEPRRFFQAVGFKNDVPYPKWRSKIFVGHLFLRGGEVLAPNVVFAGPPVRRSASEPSGHRR
jgi:hypothetical protein